MTPFFSICIPNYNYAHYLKETIDSVLSQDFENFEIIITDNCSTDGSWELIQYFKDPRIKAYRNNYNIGFAPNLQACTSKASGRFIHVLSADDKMKSNALSTYANLINLQTQTDNLFLMSDVDYIDENNVIFGIEYRNLETFSSISCVPDKYKKNPIEFNSNGHNILKSSLPLLKNPAAFLSVMVSSVLWNDVCGYNAVRTIGPDKFFNYKILSLNPKVIYVRETLFQYRIHRTANAIAQENNIKQQIDDYLNLLEFEKIFKHLDLDYDKAKNVFLNRVCFGYAIRALKKSNIKQAWRLLGMMLVFPDKAFTNLRFYLLAFLNITYPISTLSIKLIEFIKNKI